MVTIPSLAFTKIIAKATQYKTCLEVVRKYINTLISVFSLQLGVVNARHCEKARHRHFDSNHPETIIKYFVTNLNKHEHSIRGGGGISFIDAASVYIITIKELQ